MRRAIASRRSGAAAVAVAVTLSRGSVRVESSPDCTRFVVIPPLAQDAPRPAVAT